MPAESQTQQREEGAPPVTCEEGHTAGYPGPGQMRALPREGAAWAVTRLGRGRARPGPPWGQIEGCLWPLARDWDSSPLQTINQHLRDHRPGQEIEHCQKPLPFPLDHSLGPVRISCPGALGDSLAFWQLLGGPARVTLSTAGGASVPGWGWRPARRIQRFGSGTGVVGR